MATRYEHYRQPVAPRSVFLMRLVKNVAFAVVLVGASLFAGMLGYHAFEGESWLDAYDSAAMLAAGMGPFREPATAAGKAFAGSYALFCGLLLVATSGIILATVVHRLLHRFRVEDGEEAEKRTAGAKHGR